MNKPNMKTSAAVAVVVLGMPLLCFIFYRQRTIPNNEQGVAASYEKHDQAMDAYGRKDYDLAIALFSEVIPYRPHDARAYETRGQCYLMKKDYHKAIDDFTEAIRLDRKYPGIYLSRGDAYRYRGDFDQAIADYSEAIRLNPPGQAAEELAEAYANRAKAYGEKGDRDNAKSDYERAIALDPRLKK